MPDPKYTYIISDPHGNTLGAATTMKNALRLINDIELDDVEIESKWEICKNIYRYQLTNYHYIDKITLNQL
jgi:hypothetical protein